MEEMEELRLGWGAAVEDIEAELELELDVLGFLW